MAESSTDVLERPIKIETDHPEVIARGGPAPARTAPPHVGLEDIIFTKAETGENYQELSPLVRSLFEEQEVQDLMAPLYDLSPWKGDHSLDMARMVEPIYATLDRLGIPHLSVAKAVKAALLHDIGIAHNPHTADDPGMVNSSRKYTPDDRVKFGTHPEVGAERVSDPDIKAQIAAHHSYEEFKDADPNQLLADGMSVSKMVLAAMDIAHAVRDLKRPYEKWIDPNDETEKGAPILSDERTREIIKTQVPALPDGVVDCIIDVGGKVLDHPIAQHAVQESLKKNYN